MSAVREDTKFSRVSRDFTSAENGAKFCNDDELNMEEEVFEKKRFIFTFSRSFKPEITVLVGYKSNEEVHSSVWAKDVISNVE